MNNFDKKNWQKFKFGDIAKEVRVAEPKPLKNGLSRYVGLEHIESENLHIKSWGDIADGTTFTRKFVKGQVLFGRRRSYLKKAALANFNGICSGDILVFEAVNDKLLPELLPFIVQNDKFFQYAVDASAGSLSPRVKFKDLAKFELMLPKGLDKQKKLADLLWAGDKLIGKYKLLESKLKVVFLSNIKDYIERVKESQQLDSLVEIVMGQSPPGISYNENGDGVPFLQGNAEFGRKNPKHEKFTNDPKKIAINGDLLISVRAPVGDMNFADQKYCIGRGLAAIRSKKIPNRYFFYLLKYLVGELERVSSGSTFSSINKNDLSNLEIPFPKNKQEIDEFIINTELIEKAIDKNICLIEKANFINKVIINQFF